MDRQYTCAECKGVFDKGWSEEEVLAEKKATFGDIPEKDCAIVCDDCYRKLGFGRH